MVGGTWNGWAITTGEWDCCYLLQQESKVYVTWGGDHRAANGGHLNNSSLRRSESTKKVCFRIGCERKVNATWNKAISQCKYQLAKWTVRPLQLDFLKELVVWLATNNWNLNHTAYCPGLATIKQHKTIPFYCGTLSLAKDKDVPSLGKFALPDCTVIGGIPGPTTPDDSCSLILPTWILSGIAFQLPRDSRATLHNWVCHNFPKTLKAISCKQFS